MFKVLLISALAISTSACSVSSPVKTNDDAPCSEAVLTDIEHNILSSDAQGHGPDIGSSEWQSVVELTLGISGDSRYKQGVTKKWCDFIESKISPTGT